MVAAEVWVDSTVAEAWADSMAAAVVADSTVVEAATAAADTANLSARLNPGRRQLLPAFFFY